MYSPILEIEQLSIGFCKKSPQENIKNLVKNISFTLNKREILCLVGESGSGKSITARSIIGLLPSNLCCTSGRILFEGENILEKKKTVLLGLRRKTVGFVFQDPSVSLNPILSIKKQLLESFSILQNTRSNALLQIRELLDILLIKDVNNILGAYPHQLSGGMKQRICLAMAILKKPKILIADEPTTSLDVTTQVQIIQLLQKIREKYDLSILFITHNLALVKEISDRVCVMRSGELLETIDREAFFQNPRHDYSKLLLETAIKRESFHIPGVEQKSEEQILFIENLSICYKKRSFLPFLKPSGVMAVNNITFSLYKKKNLAIVGESGSGKSSIAKYLVQLLDVEDVKYTSFSILDRAANSYSYQERTKIIQLVFQGLYTSLDPKMKMYDILMYPMRAHFREKTSKYFLDKIFDILDLVQLPKNILDRYPHELSGGQCQRVSLARSLLLDPKILICDEITSALDISTQVALLEILKGIQKYLEITYLFITHDLYVAKNIAQEIIVMYQGKIEEQASTIDVFIAPKSKYTKTLIESSPSMRL